MGLSLVNASSLLYPTFSSKEPEEEELGFPTLSLGLGLGLTPKPVSSLDDAGSIISISTSAAVVAAAAGAGEVSGSNSSTSLAAPPEAKRARTEPGQGPGRFKGVVLQQNGHWGAQIYAHHSRIWLGTFRTERAAAMAYDSAAIKLHRGDPRRNFPWTELTTQEESFQELFPTEAVLGMIKDGSYESRLAEFLRFSQPPPRAPAAASSLPLSRCEKDGVEYRELFQKELTPSDVGKLNRLVIPKRCATKYLPAVSMEAVEELMLDFRDRENHLWVFRYCYWKSSQSYVFTKGWNRFVKEKKLRASDVVAFYECREMEGLKRKYPMIDVLRSEDCGGGGGGGGGGFGLKREELEVVDEEEEGEEVMSGSVVVAAAGEEERQEEAKKEVKLFGVRIN